MGFLVFMQKIDAVHLKFIQPQIEFPSKKIVISYFSVYIFNRFTTLDWEITKK